MSRPLPVPAVPRQDDARRSALRGGVVGNLVDQVHIFLPLVSLAPALPRLAGGSGPAGGATLVVIAMMLGRPVGGVLFGRIGDRLGRTRTTTVAIAGTAACTAGIALTPGHQLVGAATMWWILALRFLGGVFIAGEYSAAVPLAMEWSRPPARGLVSGLIMSMAPLAQGGTALVTWALLRALGGDDYAAWGWRTGFVAAALASLGMLAFYRRRVADHVPARPGTPIGLRALLVGAYRRGFWQLFALMTGLWLLTNMVVVALPADLVASAGLDPARVPLVVAGASLVQAGCMALAGQLSTRTGRRRFFVGWGVCAAVAGPLTWLTLMGRTDRALGAVVLLAGLLQAVTVAGYGPVGAYLAEGFPAAIRSTGYGTAYSLSIVLPALHPFYLPGLSDAVGHRAAVTGLMVLGGSLVAAAGAAGPRVGRREREATLETLQPATADAGAGRTATCGASAPTRSSARSGRARRAASRARSDRA